MFRKMRRNKQALTLEECIEILERNTSGVLATYGDNDYPYAIPLSYAYHDNHIYIHSAKSGHKLDAIKRHDKVSFCIIDQDQVIAEKYTTYFRSIIAFGQASIMSGPSKQKALTLIGSKYSRLFDYNSEVEKNLERVEMIDINIDYLSGKTSIELIKQES